MIHEKQARQLCAVHSVNNLLQLPSDFVVDLIDDDYDGERRSDVDCSPNDRSMSIVHEWTCHGKMLRTNRRVRGGGANGPSKRLWRVATQQEFDDIAREFTLREQLLMGGDESTFLSTTSRKDEVESNGISRKRIEKINGKVSLLQRFTSQYGTPYLGNYSLEVIEEALNRRGVDLEFYRVPDETHSPNEIANGEHAISDEGAGKDDGSAPSATPPSKAPIGFIIYEREESQRNALSFLSRMGSRIPLFKYFFGVGQHWYAITGVRYHQHQSHDASKRNDVNNNVGTNAGSDSAWSLVDSKMDDVPVFRTDRGLLDYLRVVQGGEGLVFRAFYAEEETKGAMIVR